MNTPAGIIQLVERFEQQCGGLCYYFFIKDDHERHQIIQD